MVALAEPFTKPPEQSRPPARIGRLRPQTKITLLPVELESKDRAVHGSVEIPEGWTDFRLQFTNKDTSQDLGTYSLSDTSPTGPFIYDSLEDVGSDDEINQLLGEQGDRRRVEQEVVFVRDSENPDKIDFYTVFDEVGEIEVKIIFGPNDTEGVVTHTLEADDELGPVISTWDARVESLELPEIPDVPIDWDGDGYADPGASEGMLAASQPGTMSQPGAFVTESQENDPLNLIVLINDDDDNGDTFADNSDTSIDAADDDIVRFDLQLPQGVNPNAGTVTLSVSDSSKLRLFTQDGTAQLTNFSVNLASPSGDLADMVNGQMALWGEALAESSDVTVTLTYDDGQGGVQSDTVHLTTSNTQTASLLYMIDPMRAVAASQVRMRMIDGISGRMQWRLHHLTLIGESEPIQNRNFVSKFGIWLFESGGADLWGSWLIGYTEGFWDMAQAEVEGIGELIGFVQDPVGRFKAMYEGAKQLAGLSLDEYKVIAESLFNDYLNSIEENLPWQNEGNLTATQLLYSYGYLGGVATEVAVVTVATAGIGNAIKGTLIAAKAGQAAGVVASQTRKFTMAMFRKASQYVPDTRKLNKIKKHLETEKRGGKSLAEITQDKLDELDANTINQDVIAEEISKYCGPDEWDDIGLRAYRRLAEIVDVLGNQATAEALRSFVKLYGRMRGPDNSDLFPDFIDMFDADTPAGKQKLREFLENSENIIDDPASVPGTGPFPGNRGFAGTPTTESVPQGKILSRYGSNNGEFLADDGIPLWARSLPDGTDPASLRRYEVLQSFDASTGRTAPWFGKPGGGVQYDLGVGNTVQDLIDANLIREL